MHAKLSWIYAKMNQRLEITMGRLRAERMVSSPANPPSSLLCSKDCEHQRETASSAVNVNVACTYPWAQIPSSISQRWCIWCSRHVLFTDGVHRSLIWCDFGVGSRMTEYPSNLWKFIITAGGLSGGLFYANQRKDKRVVGGGVRQRKAVDESGIPANDYVELSLLGPHIRFQNSMAILQKRVVGNGGARFSEPLYSESAWKMKWLEYVSCVLLHAFLPLNKERRPIIKSPSLAVE